MHPTSTRLNTLSAVLNDTELNPNENNYVIKKLDLFMDQCNTEYAEQFYNLSSSNQEELVDKKINSKDLQTWFSRLLTLIFEALLLDPAYGGNTDKAVWLWLDHDPGYPRSKMVNSYPNILMKKNEI